MEFTIYALFATVILAVAVAHIQLRLRLKHRTEGATFAVNLAKAMYENLRLIEIDPKERVMHEAVCGIAKNYITTMERGVGLLKKL